MLVSILAIIVLSAVLILRIATTSFMASSNRQLNQDQAYELAASLGSSIDILISEGKLDLDDYPSTTIIYSKESGFANLPKPGNGLKMLEAKIIVKSDVKTVQVTANVGKAHYVYTKEYR